MRYFPKMPCLISCLALLAIPFIGEGQSSQSHTRSNSNKPLIFTMWHHDGSKPVLFTFGASSPGTHGTATFAFGDTPVSLDKFDGTTLLMSFTAAGMSGAYTGRVNGNEIVGTVLISVGGQTATNTWDGAFGDVRIVPAMPIGSIDTAHVCRSNKTLQTMLLLVNRERSDPTGSVLGDMACLITGMCPDTKQVAEVEVTALASRPSSDGGVYTSNDPGSFLCQGFFARGEIHLETSGIDGDGNPIFTQATQKLINSFPSFHEDFKVKPLRKGRFQLILIPSIKGMSQYATEFSFP